MLHERTMVDLAADRPASETTFFDSSLVEVELAGWGRYDRRENSGIHPAGGQVTHVARASLS